MQTTSHTYRTLSIGGATYDLFLTLPDHLESSNGVCLPCGGKVHIDHIVETVGGGACNTAVGLKRLGCNAAFCGVIGSDQWGERLLASLQREGVDITPATIVENETSSFSIILRLSNGERTILSAAGASEHLHDVTMDLRSATNADAIILNHLQESSCVILDNLCTLVEKETNITLVWNPGGCQLRRGMHEPTTVRLLRSTDLLILNREEAELFTGEKVLSQMMRSLHETGVRIACITDGAHGVWGSDGATILHCSTREDVSIVDATGAGDAFTSGATWALLEESALPDLLIAGTLNAVSVLGAIGAHAGLLTRDALATRKTESPLAITIA